MAKTYTGHQIRDAIARWKLQRDTFVARFDESLVDFADSSKAKPDAIMTEIMKAEVALATLQTIQQDFNQMVKVEVNKEIISLSQATKLVGGYTRAKNAWVKAIKGDDKKTKSFYGRIAQITVKKDGERYQEKRITDDEAMAMAKSAMAMLQMLQSAIAKGNAEVFEVRDVKTIGYLEV